ncbi:MAG: hypothetical protein JWM34_2522 [Ilumatobacteraceae bacterium]|nr:hypothetical protein [Ilumatobacteraceae bacterium]
MPGSTGPTSRVVALCFDAIDARHQASFWAAALGWAVDDGSEGDVSVVPTDMTRFHLRFRTVTAEKVEKNPIHLDLTTSSIQDQTSTVEHLIELGGRHVDVGQGPDDQHVVLADPEGNELCVIEPTNAFLAGCERLGSITCDGSPRVGRFWSDVLGWPLVWDQDDETAVRDPDGTGPFITWGPPIPPRPVRNRLRLEIAPPGGAPVQTEIDRLLALGATLADGQDGAHPRGVEMIDPDGNGFTLLSPT